MFVECLAQRRKPLQAGFLLTCSNPSCLPFPSNAEALFLGLKNRLGIVVVACLTAVISNVNACSMLFKLTLANV